MKKFLLTTALSTLILGAGAAQAQTGGNLSASVLGGWTWHPDLQLNNARQSVDDGYNLGARLSYKMTEPGASGLSLDADYLYHRSNYAAVSDTHLASSSFMGDIVYHMQTASPWSLYGGGGAGVVQTSLNGKQHGSSAVFGWQVLGGTEYAFTPNTSLFAEYRYQNAHDAHIAGAGNVGNTSNNLSLGVKFQLP